MRDIFMQKLYLYNCYTNFYFLGNQNGWANFKTSRVGFIKGF